MRFVRHYVAPRLPAPRRDPAPRRPNVLHSKVTIMLLTLCCVWVALGQTPPQTPAPQEKAAQIDTEQHSSADVTAKWPTFNIYVCWENPEPKYESECARESANLVRFTPA